MIARGLQRKGKAMRQAKQCGLPLHRKDYTGRIREGSRRELVRLLAQLLIQALGRERKEQGGAGWTR